ncbi:DNA-binding MarR family transcriptional regulator [Amycolatopsis bartoniae]|uniref:HTH marR-type domain-containing protein n=1 Tax=Amycolatopsis bartoniae TaxID=941986 RepID=A0A8H9IP93_9PSEU|nr:MarR family transcriptional regulator [Amycolatopsis bartoniae]MBB2938128.1 DNA-binding MarR family transcriptional regulator [Amycolatopsis bartoniae]TVS99443.1 MarR family transcriptional regulator [Amycolatopsis bartoniae]GHF32861.1 hypothetical protein GCM10017566_01810 [Amycolatopsis bartoniae]
MTEPDPGEQLLRLMAPMRRAIIRATRVAEGLPTLPEAKVAVLRTLVRTGPLPPAQLALELHLARPTVSNLVRDMVGEGLLERRPSDLDKRSVLLVPTARARRVLDKFTRGRKEVVSRALAEIPARDRARVLNALPSLHRLLVRLEAMADQSGAEETA